MFGCRATCDTEAPRSADSCLERKRRRRRRRKRGHVGHVMSLSITAYPFPWGHRVLLLEPIPALSQGEGRVLPGQVARALTDEQCGVQYLAQRHFDMQPSLARSRDLN